MLFSMLRSIANNQLTAPRIVRFCISHKYPLLPRNWYDYCISLGDYDSDSDLHVSNLSSYWHQARPLAFGTAGSYVIPNALESMNAMFSHIEISSYRKRVIPKVLGLESPNYSTMVELDLFIADKFHGNLAVLPIPGHDFLVSRPLNLPFSIFEQYAKFHKTIDLIDYTSLAVEINIMSNSDVDEFLFSKTLIPGGLELGIFPADFLIDKIYNLQVLGRKFLDKYSGRIQKYDPYQIRSIGFLSERLGSFLLLRHLISIYGTEIPAELFGYMTVITENGKNYHAGTSEG